MRIIFIKNYTDYDSFAIPLLIKEGEIALLIDEASGKVELSEGLDERVIIEGVPAGSYVEYLGEAEGELI